jgi:hypothetical protein
MGFEFLDGIDPADVIESDVNADASVAVERAIVGDPASFKGFDGLLAALGGHVDGYTEIASEGGVHWYARDDDNSA